MKSNSFLDEKELAAIGFKSIGTGCMISRKASFYNPPGIVIGNHVRIDDYCIISGNIVLHDYIHISAYTSLFSGEAKIEVENYCAISSRVAIYAESDDYSGEGMVNPMVPNELRKVEYGDVLIKAHSIIGTGCTVLPGVTISEGVSVGAMSLINKSLDEWKIYAGIPCRVLRERSKELLKKAEELERIQ